MRNMMGWKGSREEGEGGKKRRGEMQIWEVRGAIGRERMEGGTAIM